MIWPFFGAFMLATGTLLERLVLMKKIISVKFYQSAQFTAIVIAMLPFIPFFWEISREALTLKNILIFIGIIIISILANYITFYSMKNRQLSKIESAKITEPLFIILLAFIFSFIFGTGLYQRNSNILIPSLIAAAALILSNIKKKHIKFNKYYLFAISGSFLFALELVLSRLILNFYNPITFYFLRCIFVLAASLIIMKPKFNKNIDTKTILQILSTGAIKMAYRLIIYLGYVGLGVIETTLTLMLGPILIYFFAWKFLKEKITWTQILTAVIILGCIAYIWLV
ncbi:MAG: EamA family transporter [Nanoarchaeota archaeon]|jgi:drug/metabolite transporter (DMT)-like permease|nr:EamA family transporter [Nanoarchaeota archaeon]